MRIQWHKPGEKVFETGVSNGVLFEPNAQGEYDSGVPWNGLTTVTESPSGAESNKQYADNTVYANIKSVEEAGFTIEAFTCPREFYKYDGMAAVNGVLVGQQNRRSFGFSWKSLIGNDLEGLDFGYKLHLAWGCDAAPSEKTNATVNDSPEAGALSWEVTTSPVNVDGVNPDTGKPFRPTAKLTIPSTDVNADALAALEDILYGTEGVDPRLPSPSEVLALFAGGDAPVVVESQAPAYDPATDIITIPNTVGVVYSVDGEDVPAGPFGPIAADTIVHARAAEGYVLSEGSDDDFAINYVP